MKITKLIGFGSLGVLSMATWLLTGATTLNAQDGPPQGGFSPTQMRQRMLERMREQFEVTDDSEWKLIAERITKVMDARRAMGGVGRPGGPFGGLGGPPPMNGGGPGPNQSATDAGANDAAGGSGGPAGSDGPGGPPPGGPGMFNREPNPELEALHTAIEAKAPSAELKNRIAELKAAQARKQAELKKAQEELKQLLSTRQEAIAVTFGLL